MFSDPLIIISRKHDETMKKNNIRGLDLPEETFVTIFWQDLMLLLYTVLGVQV